MTNHRNNTIEPGVKMPTPSDQLVTRLNPAISEYGRNNVIHWLCHPVLTVILLDFKVRSFANTVHAAAMEPLRHRHLFTHQWDRFRQLVVAYAVRLLVSLELPGTGTIHELGLDRKAMQKYSPAGEAWSSAIRDMVKFTISNNALTGLDIRSPTWAKSFCEICFEVLFGLNTELGSGQPGGFFDSLFGMMDSYATYGMQTVYFGNAGLDGAMDIDPKVASMQSRIRHDAETDAYNLSRDRPETTGYATSTASRATTHPEDIIEDLHEQVAQLKNALDAAQTQIRNMQSANADIEYHANAITKALHGSH